MTVIKQWTKNLMLEENSNYDCREMSLDEAVNMLNEQNKYIELADEYRATANRVIRNLEEKIEHLENQIEELNKRGDTNG
jgi:hypothetical protein